MFKYPDIYGPTLGNIATTPSEEYNTNADNEYNKYNMY